MRVRLNQRKRCLLRSADRGRKEKKSEKNLKKQKQEGNIEAGKKFLRRWDVKQRGKAREGPLRE